MNLPLSGVTISSLAHIHPTHSQISPEIEPHRRMNFFHRYVAVLESINLYALCPVSAALASPCQPYRFDVESPSNFILRNSLPIVVEVRAMVLL
jgi:hypothetical protein